MAALLLRGVCSVTHSDGVLVCAPAGSLNDNSLGWKDYATRLDTGPCVPLCSAALRCSLFALFLARLLLRCLFPRLPCCLSAPMTRCVQLNLLSAPCVASLLLCAAGTFVIALGSVGLVFATLSIVSRLNKLLFARLPAQLPTLPLPTLRYAACRLTCVPVLSPHHLLLRRPLLAL